MISAWIARVMCMIGPVIYTIKSALVFFGFHLCVCVCVCVCVCLCVCKRARVCGTMCMGVCMRMIH